MLQYGTELVTERSTSDKLIGFIFIPTKKDGLVQILFGCWLRRGRSLLDEGDLKA
jgi:hypothetical protein